MDKVFVFLAGIVTLATIAVLVSRKADTANVVKAVGGTVANVITAATSPVAGTSAPAQFGG